MLMSHKTGDTSVPTRTEQEERRHFCFSNTMKNMQAANKDWSD